MSTFNREIRRAIFKHMADNMPPMLHNHTVLIDYGQQLEVTHKDSLWVEFINEAFVLDGDPMRGTYKRRNGEMQWNCYFRGNDFQTTICDLVDTVSSVWDSQLINTENYKIQMYEPDVTVISREANFEQHAVTIDFSIRG